MITVIMPMKEPGQFYQKAINSIHANFPTAEIIVVGPEVAADHDVVREHIDNGTIKFFREPQKNLYSALNLAVSKASNAQIAWINVDDEMALLTDEAKKIVLKNSSDIYAFNVEFMNEEGNTTQMIECYDSGTFGSNFRDLWYCYVNSMIVKREVMSRCPFDENFRICSDRKYLFDLARQRPSVLKINSTLVRYRRHDASLTFNSQNRFKRRENAKSINQDLHTIYIREIVRPSSINSLLVAAVRYVRNIFEPFLFFLVKK